MTTRPDLSVLIVSWNTRDLLLQALSSCRGTLGGLSCEILVVDNGSEDGSADAVAAGYPDVRLLRMARNRGFAAAVNAAAETARGDFLLILNSDARLQPGAAEALIEVLRHRPRAGLAGANLRRPDGGGQRSCAAEPRLWSELAGHGLAARLSPGAWGPRAGTATHPVEVETLVGAAFAIRRECLESIGPLDERFFVFLEETDWCVRARRAGWGVWWVPGADVIHEQGASRRRADLRAKIEYTRSLLRYFHKHGGGAMAAGLAAILFVKNLAGALIHAAATLATLGLRVSSRRRASRAGAVAAWLLLGGRPAWGLQTRHVRWERYGPRHLSDGITWWLDLDGPPGAMPVSLERWIDPDPWICLKDLPGKAVYRAGPEGAGYLVKRFKPLPRRTGWRSLFRPSRALREQLVAPELQGRGVPCVRPVNVGERRVMGFLHESCAVYPFLSGARGVDVVLAEWSGLSFDDRDTWAVALGRFCRRIHDAGVDPYDLEPNNVLALLGATPALRLVDYEKVRLRRGPLSRGARLRSLSKWERWRGPSRGDRLRALAAYLDVPRADPELRAWARDLASAVAAMKRRDRRATARRCLGENRNYGIYRREGWTLAYRKRRPERGQDGIAIERVPRIWAEARAVEGECIAPPFRLMRVNGARERWIRSEADRRLVAYIRDLHDLDPAMPMGVLFRDGGGDGVLIFPAGPEAA